MSQNAVIRAIEESFRRTNLPGFRPGDSVRVHTLIKEGDKERVQVFEGVCIDRKEGGSRATFTVRKISYGVGVERIFPLHSTRIEKVELTSRGRVRRARLNYLRGLEGKAARIKTEKYDPEKAAKAAEKAEKADKGGAAPATPPVAPAA